MKQGINSDDGERWSDDERDNSPLHRWSCSANQVGWVRGTIWARKNVALWLAGFQQQQSPPTAGAFWSLLSCWAVLTEERQALEGLALTIFDDFH